MFFYAPLSSFYPLMTSDYFNLSAMYGSAVELAFALGMMISSLMFSSVLKIKRKIRTSFIGLFGMGISAAICGLIPPTYWGWFFFAAACVMSRRVGKYPFHSLNRVYSGNRCSGKNGKGLFRAYLDFLCNNACRFTGGEPCRGKSRCKCLVFSVWRHYDNYYKYPDMVQ